MADELVRLRDGHSEYGMIFEYECKSETEEAIKGVQSYIFEPDLRGVFLLLSDSNLKLNTEL